MATVFIMRGIPGCGKSTWIQENSLKKSTLVLSADHYFIDKNGVYRFDPLKLSEAHNQCLKNFILTLTQVIGLWGIFVDNTNCKVWELAPYYRIAECFGSSPTIVQFVGDPVKFAQRNTHNVPIEKCLEMHKGMDALPPWWNVEYVISE